MKCMDFLKRNLTLVRAAGVLAFIGVVATGCVVFASAAPITREQTISAGRQIFVNNCAACHGERGDRVPVAPLSSKEFLDLRGDATLVHVVGEGKGVMPAWGQMRGGPLSAGQIDAVVAYLNATAGRTSPTILANSGRMLFLDQCSRCHGERGDRIPAAQLAAKAFLDSRTDPQIAQVIEEGKGQMPAFRNRVPMVLTDEQVQALIAYLRYNADTALADEARVGRDLYVGNCLACHGERGDRVPNVALTSPELLRRLGDGLVTAVIANGAGVMPAFGVAKGGRLQAGDIGALLAYLKSTAGLPAGAALVGTEMPGQGRELYMKNCAGCHGEGGDKVVGANIKSRDFLNGRNDSTLQKQIGQGNARGMPAWGLAAGGPLSEADIKNLIDYMRAAAGSAPVPAEEAKPTGSAKAPATMAGASDAIATRGKELYGKYCAGCHADSRDRIASAKLADASWLAERGDGNLRQSIASGKESMPSWGKEKGGPLTADDIAAVIGYLKAAALGTPVSSITKPLPVLTGDAAHGQDLYSKTCVACHGATRDKVPASKLASAAWLAERGDDALGASILNGKGGMPGWATGKGGPLSAADVSAILAFLKAVAAQ